MLATVLIINKSFMRTILVHINNFTSSLTDWQSQPKLETGLQVELQMTELLALLEQTVLVTLKCFDKLANTVDITDITDIIGKDRFANS